MRPRHTSRELASGNTETAGPSPRGNPFRYTGREFDAETGLYYYRARYYSTGLGRFLEPDPIGFGDGLNVYAYVGNNPINFVDPLGLFGQSGGFQSSAGFRTTQADLDFLNAIDQPIQPAIGPVELLGGVAGLARLGVVGVGSLLTRQAARGVPSSRALIRRDFDTLAPNDGFLGGFRTTETLRPGTVIDRFGGRRGTFASPAGTPFSRRGLPPEAASRRLDTLEVARPLDVDAGIAAPAFGGGGGVQFRLPATVQELIDAGVLAPK